MRLYLGLFLLSPFFLVQLLPYGLPVLLQFLHFPLELQEHRQVRRGLSLILSKHGTTLWISRNAALTGL